MQQKVTRYDKSRSSLDQGSRQRQLASWASDVVPYKLRRYRYSQQTLTGDRRFAFNDELASYRSTCESVYRSTYRSIDRCIYRLSTDQSIVPSSNLSIDLSKWQFHHWLANIENCLLQHCLVAAEQVRVGKMPFDDITRWSDHRSINRLLDRLMDR